MSLAAKSIPQNRTYFGGQLEFSRECSGVVMSEVTYCGKRKWMGHSHNRAFFAFLLNGGYQEYYRNHDVEYRPHTLNFRPAGMTHRDEITAAGTKFFITEIANSWEKRLREYSPQINLSPDFCDADGPWLAMSLYDAIKHSPSFSPLLVEGIVSDLLAGLIKRPKFLERKKPPKKSSFKVDDSGCPQLYSRCQDW